MSPGAYPYDLVPFRSTCVSAADCGRIEAIARLFGLTAAPCAQARVLELGCGSAANLLPLALQHPGARFIGCDLSRSALASAQRICDGLGLTNLELRHADIRDVDEGWGGFDYILCHDVFSWVAPDVRHSILAILRRNLAARGVGYVSYDALPGWQLRGIVRDMMRYHGGDLSDPRQAVERARAILAMGAAVQDQKPGPYAELLRDEYCIFSTFSDEQLYHLAFSEHHQPFYFFEFARIVDDAGLQFLSDADVTRMCGPRAPAAARAFLDQHPRPDRLQYWDFLNNCVWRGALLCRRDVPLAGRLEDGALRDCWISLATGRSSELVAPDPLTRQALSCLEQRRPEFVAFSDLAEDGELPTAFFMDAYTAGSIDVTFSPPTLSSRISDRPAVSPLVRLQVRDGSTVTNQKREAVRLTEVVRHVVHLLDGNHGWNELAESVADEIQSGRLADEWILRLEDDELDAGRLTGNILRHVRDRALLVA